MNKNADIKIYGMLNGRLTSLIIFRRINYQQRVLIRECIGNNSFMVRNYVINRIDKRI